LLGLPEWSGIMVKLIVAIKRKQGMSPKDFHDHWGTQHATLVNSCPASRRYIRKYVQCHTLEGEYSAGEPAFDGAAELWFESVAEKERFFSDPDYLAQVKPDEARFSDMSRTLFFLTEDKPII
jgi:uncharacterized protein (TIGR02118 family)